MEGNGADIDTEVLVGEAFFRHRTTVLGCLDRLNLGGGTSSMVGMLSPQTHIGRRVWRADLPTCSHHCRSGYFYSTSLGDAAACGLSEISFPSGFFSSSRYLLARLRQRDLSRLAGPSQRDPSRLAGPSFHCKTHLQCRNFAFSGIF